MSIVITNILAELDHAARTEAGLILDHATCAAFARQLREMFPVEPKPALRLVTDEEQLGFAFGDDHGGQLN